MVHDIPEVEKEGCVPEFEIGRRMPGKENKIQINIIPQSDSALTLRPYLRYPAFRDQLYGILIMRR